MSKPAMIFIPGVLCDQRSWLSLIENYQGEYPCFICMWENGDNLPGFIDRILNLVSGPIILIGHSMGGRLALLTALESPARIIGLCCVNSSADHDIPKKRQSRIDMIESVQMKIDWYLSSVS